jgi:hypothetical protein
LAIVDRVVDFCIAALQPNLDRMQPTDLRFGLVIVIKAVAAMTWLGARDHADEMRSGVLQREVGLMMARYLVRPTT